MRVRDDSKIIKIQDATIKIINEYGIGSATMQKISKEAGIAGGSIYTYYEDKHDMLNKVFLSVEKEFSEYTLNAFDESKTVKENFYSIWEALYKFSKENEAKYQFIETLKRNPIIDEESRIEIHEYYGLLINYIHKAKTDGVIINVPDSLIAVFSFFSIAHLIDCPVIEDCKIDESEYLDMAFKMAWNSITCPL